MTDFRSGHPLWKINKAYGLRGALTAAFCAAARVWGSPNGKRIKMLLQRLPERASLAMRPRL